MFFRSKYFIPLILGCAAALVFGVIIAALLSKDNEAAEHPLTCTQEAKVCPDGTAVGRSGPKCEFAACPELQKQLTVYESEFLQVTLQDGWTASEAIQTVYEGSKETHPLNPAAVNITKDKYILYINTMAQQASGVEGGRFAEISMGAPSADAVVTYQPSNPCGTSEKYSAFKDHSRMDWYVSKRDAQDWCATPTGDSTVWYFSYISKKGGYINYYYFTPDSPPGYVITMAYDSKDIDSFPKKDSPELQKALADMTSMVDSLILKRQGE
jgi:hypothetical protein